MTPRWLLTLFAGLVLACGGAIQPSSVPAAVLPIAPSRALVLPTSGAVLELEDLPSGWQVTRETINNARELADDPTEVGALAEQGFIQNRQRDFENRYGGGPRRLFTSLTRFEDAAGAAARVRYVASVTRERASTIQLDSFAPEGLDGDDAVTMRLDNGNGELASVAYFRVGSWSVGMMAVGYSDPGAFLLASANRQADRLRLLLP